FFSTFLHKKARTFRCVLELFYEFLKLMTLQLSEFHSGRKHSQKIQTPAGDSAFVRGRLFIEILRKISARLLLLEIAD
ncbi:hypothetical protein, partial [uncultured Dialister sp.]|uniref:hypothetical protein n=1 Tax=uncultured Dialister sp. TaxID=278064 RepID=UPI0025DE586F